jgi:hypothetical protein
VDERQIALAELVGGNCFGLAVQCSRNRRAKVCVRLARRAAASFLLKSQINGLRQAGCEARSSATLAEDAWLIRMDALTDDPFDWLMTLAIASKLVLIDSCFSNLVEQMNLPKEKYLIARSAIRFTPVYKNGWQFTFVDPRPA